MNKAFTYILVGASTGLVSASIVAYILRRRYEGKIDEAVQKESKVLKEKLMDRDELIDLATHELFELRKAVAAFCDVSISSTILANVRHIIESDDYESKLRPALETMIAEHSQDAKTVKKKTADAFIARSITDQLGYSKPDLENLWALRMKAVREAAEKNMAESEYPGEEAGAERLAPNGDILDEAYDEDDDDNVNNDELDGIMVPGDDWSRKWNKPYIIPEWEFTNSHSHYTKCSIDYYAGDDTLVDEDETRMDQSFVGEDNLRAFEETEEPSIFVRNDQIDIDYEILWHEESYAEAFDGVDPVEVTGKRIWRPWEKEEDY